MRSDPRKHRSREADIQRLIAISDRLKVTDARLRASRWLAAITRAGPNRRQQLTVTIVVAVIYLGIVFYGSDSAALALMMDAAWGIALALALWACPNDMTLVKVRSFQAICVIFGVLVIYLLATLAPVPVGATRAYWRWVGDGAATIDRSATALEIVKLLGLAAAFVTGMCIGGSDQRARTTLKYIYWTGVCYGLWALIQHFADPRRVVFTFKDTFQTRLTASFFSSNIAAAFLGALVVMGVPKVESVDGGGRLGLERDLSYLGRLLSLLVLMACVVMTGSRMGTLATGIALVVVTALYPWRRAGGTDALRALRLRIVPLVLMGVMALSAGVLMDRMLQSQGDVDGRKLIAASHWAAFLKSAVVGYGLGGYQAVNNLLVTPETFSKIWYVRAAHNTYLQWLEEAGLIGAGLMAVLLCLVVYEIVRGLRARETARKQLRVVIGVATLFAVHASKDFTLQMPAICLFLSFILGVGFSVGLGGSRAISRTPVPANSSLGRVATWAPRGLSIVTQVGALALLWGSSYKAAELHFPLVLRTAYEELAILSVSDPAVDPSQSRARAAAMAALRLAPTDAVAWTILADLRGPVAGRLAALEHSYESDPIDPGLLQWRAVYAARNWDSLTPRLRAMVLRDITAERTQWGASEWLRKLAVQSGPSAFGLALQFALAEPAVTSAEAGLVADRPDK
jgi:O-antigen ligase